jgi:hypothetical protein
MSRSIENAFYASPLPPKPKPGLWCGLPSLIEKSKSDTVSARDDIEYRC